MADAMRPVIEVTLFVAVVLALIWVRFRRRPIGRFTAAMWVLWRRNRRNRRGLM